MRLSELLCSAGVDAERYGRDVSVRGVCDDSRRCGRDDCFVAVRGVHVDGHAYVADAIRAGSTAVVCEDPAGVPKGVAYATVADTAAAAGRLAQAALDWPCRKLTCIAVTGTNGKSTVTHLIRSVLQSAGHAPGLLGTITYETGRRIVPAGTTTPGAVELAALTEEMRAVGRTHLVMEASSHALHQRRTDGIEFDVGVFTNLSGDHLDYHGTMENYLAAKRRLFESLGDSATAVLNRDDPYSEALAAATAARVVWYGLSPASDVRARIERIDAAGAQFALSDGEGEATARTPLIGRHNVLNCLAAAGACVTLGVPLAQVAAAIEQVERVPGRLERVAAQAPFDVFVDYAHTDDALRNVLSSLRPITRGRILVAFGCGGDRDRTKRPRMGATAADLADVVVVTSDNPRSERPEAIIEEILSGIDESGRAKTRVEPDRREAISLALREAREGDVVLIAGKGHESYQDIGGKRIPFVDAEVAAEQLRTLDELNGGPA